MKVEIFDFELPKELIANQPADPRDSSKLLDLSVEGKIRDKVFTDIVDILNPNDLIVFNNTKVIPAKLHGIKGEAKVEVTLYRPVDGINWWAFIKNSKRLKIQDTIIFYNENIPSNKSKFTADVVEKKGDEGVLLKFNSNPEDLAKFLEDYGTMPLPPYIKRDNDNPNDKENYQTIYAKHEGAVAAPTAGLHFTDRVFKSLEEKGIKKAFLTLHVGAGTFLPVKADDTKDHKMHSEYGIIDQTTANLINETKKKGGKIIAVGTTALRLLESAADDNGVVHPFANDTDIFITPGYKFKVIDMLMTNFHLPKSTLFMLVSAVAGLDVMKKAYQHAIDNNYRFYSYGDTSILKCVNKI